MYSASVTNRGTSKNYAKTRHGEFTIASDGEHSCSTDTLLAGLCGCIAYHLRNAMVERQLAYALFVVKAASDFTPDRTRLGAIDVAIEMEGAQLDSTDDITFLIAAAEACQLRNSLKANSHINVSFTVNGKAYDQVAV